MTGYDKALNAYQNAQESHMSQEQIFAELLKGIITNTYKARDAHHAQEFEEVVKINDKTAKIITALRTTLDFETYPEASAMLHNLFINITRRHSASFRQDDIDAHYEEIVDLVKPVYDRWADFAKNGKLTESEAS